MIVWVYSMLPFVFVWNCWKTSICSRPKIMGNNYF